MIESLKMTNKMKIKYNMTLTEDRFKDCQLLGIFCLLGRWRAIITLLQVVYDQLFTVSQSASVLYKTDISKLYTDWLMSNNKLVVACFECIENCLGVLYVGTNNDVRKFPESGRFDFVRFRGSGQLRLRARGGNRLIGSTEKRK